MRVIVYTDGAARGNPGISASGFIVIDAHGKTLKRGIRYNGIKTNNYAEYMAIIIALRWCAVNLPEGTEVELYSDSELVVKQLNGTYKIRSEQLKTMNNKVKETAMGIKPVFKNLPRRNEMISIVDRQLNIFLDSKSKHR